MADYVITTDSNSDVLPEFIRENDLTIIPQYYSFGDIVYGDELNMPPHEFYETMRNGELPKSQANNPAVIRGRFEKERISFTLHFPVRSAEAATMWS